MCRRHGSQRSTAGDADALPHAEYAQEPRAGARAEHHGALVDAASGGVQTLSASGFPPSVVHPVRERRPYAALLGRRLRHRLLRVSHAHRPSDAVLRGPGQFGECCSTPSMAAGTSERRPGRPGCTRGRGRRPRVRRRGGEVRRHDGVAGADLRARDELYPLHARQVLLRAPRDGAARPGRSCAPWPSASPASRWWRTAFRRSSTRKVKPVRREHGLVVGYEIDRRFPAYGNNDDRVDASPPTSSRPS